VHQFSLAALAPTLRWELLYALQQRDAQGQKLDPGAVRGLVTAVADLEALATTPYLEVAQRISTARNVRAYAHLLTRIIDLKFEEFRGIAHTDKDVWDCLALDLEAPRAGRRPNLSSVEFTPISQRWLRDATKDWVHTFRPDSTQLRRTVQACTLASRALSVRPGGGQEPHDLRFADMTAVFQALKNATQAGGQLYTSHYRRGLWARFVAVIDLGRSTELLRDLPATFRRHPSHTIIEEDITEDQIGKAIPETVITQLDAHLDLLGTEDRYGRVWSITDTATMFRTVYQVLRDTGRRPGELVPLAVDCLEVEAGEYALVYDNRKKHRLRRRLPITAETAASIQHWQHYRAGLDLPASAQRWLFPACNESSGPGHLTTHRFARALHQWVAAIPVLHSDLPGPEGSPIPFDRSLIYPYAFRHSYAQRHADAGVSVEILKELMDHTDLKVTQGYYTVSLKRKREAIKVMSRYVHNRSGAPCPGPGSVTRYELRSVAVPFGNCIEPTNVKAGGKQCPIRFQCAGCGFYRPDPSYLPAIEEHINTLKADRETALAMDTDEFVVRNLADQVTAFTQVAATMREKMQNLPEAERAEVEQASAVLRKLRAGGDVSGGHRLLPLTVKDTT
jgi:integrase